MHAPGPGFPSESWRKTMTSEEYSESPDGDGLGNHQWSPNSVTPYSGSESCEGCDEDAEWTVELIDQHAQTTEVRCCSEHAADYWGYDPREDYE